MSQREIFSFNNLYLNTADSVTEFSHRLQEKEMYRRKTKFLSFSLKTIDRFALHSVENMEFETKKIQIA